jgi:hypothetical protein
LFAEELDIFCCYKKEEERLLITAAFLLSSPLRCAKYTTLLYHDNKNALVIKCTAI